MLSENEINRLGQLGDSAWDLFQSFLIILEALHSGEFYSDKCYIMRP
jgi:hypothetical protein